MSDDQHLPLLFHKVDNLTLQTRLTDTVCNILFILGVVGNILGLLIFSSSRRSWRISSVYTCLATSSSIANLFCVIRYSSILHSTSRILLREVIGHKWWACKLYKLSFSFRVISSWITLFWMFERLLCISRRLRLFFNRWNSYKLKFIIPILMLIIILSCVIGPPVYMFQPQILRNDTSNSTTNTILCEIHPNASIKWQTYFHEVNFGRNHFTIRCLLSELIPAGTIILFNSFIVYHLVRTDRNLHRTSSHRPRPKQSRTTSWMNIVLILHSTLFLSSLFSHIVGHFTVIDAHETWWILLSVLINCCLNFYMYCLSGKAFRNEIRRFIHNFKAECLYKLYRRQHQPQRYYHTHPVENLVYELHRF